MFLQAKPVDVRVLRRLPFANRSISPRRLPLQAFSLVELLVVAALIVVMFVMLYGKSSRRFQYEQKQACQGNLQNIYVALQLYANDFAGEFPRKANAKTSEQALAALIPKYTTVTAPFICPGTKRSSLPEGQSIEERRISYAYYMGRKVAGAAEPLMSDAQSNEGEKQKGDRVFSADGKAPGNNHHQYGGNIMNCDGNVQMISGRADRPLPLGPGVVLLNPKP